MVLRIFSGIVMLLLALTVVGCSSGGSSSSGGTTSSSGGSAVSGVASKGIIVNGTVKVYAVTIQGEKGALLGSATTDAEGRYTVDFGDYQGALLVEVSGGTYLDEATGIELTIPDDEPLRAIVHDATGDLSTAVTPLTELAVLLAEQAGNMSVERIMMANAQISHFFGVDIVSVMPVLVGDEGFGEGDSQQKNYSLLLATISQLMENQGDASVAELLAKLFSEIQVELGGAMNGAVSRNIPEIFEQAREDYLEAHDEAKQAWQQDQQANLDRERPELADKKITLFVSGTVPAGKNISGVHVLFTLPEDSCEKVVEGNDDLKEKIGIEGEGKILRIYQPEIARVFDEENWLIVKMSYSHENLYGGPLLNIASVCKEPLTTATSAPEAGSTAGAFTEVRAKLPTTITAADIEFIQSKVVDQNGVAIDNLSISVIIEDVEDDEGGID